MVVISITFFLSLPYCLHIIIIATFKLYLAASSLSRAAFLAACRCLLLLYIYLLVMLLRQIN